MFRTGVEETPVSIAGTAFLVGYGRHVYLVTAAHVTRGEPVFDSLFVFPSDTAKKPLRFTRWWPIQAFQGDELDEDASDISAIRIDMTQIARTDRKNSHVINLNSSRSWFGTRFVSNFFFCGYPNTANSVDYFHREVNTAQFFLAGRYIRPDQHSGFTHQLSVDSDPHELQDFNGMSGSPVLSVAQLGSDSVMPKFCGMALRGSANSRIVHFLEAEALVSTLAEIDRE